MCEYPYNHGGLLDGGDDLQGAATLRAMLDINSENALEQPRPVHARRRAVRVFVCRLALRRTWNDRGAQPGVGRQHAVKTDQMQARTRHQGGRCCMNSSGDILMCVVPSR